MKTSKLRQSCAALPVFPLPRVILMPGTLLPLHVFEPRYRALVKHALDGERLIGVATLKPGHEDEYHGRPPIYPEIGVGRMVSYQPYPDGRSNIVLKHVGSARACQEIEGPERFRVFRCDLAEQHDDTPRVAVDALRTLLLQIGGANERTACEVRQLADMHDLAMVDELARRLLDDTEDRLRYLTVPRMSQRVRMVQDRLATMISVRGMVGAEA